jgi:hypothetical protein
MTIGSAYALNRETEVGSLAPGKYADLIVLEKNPLDSAADQLGDNQVLMTVVGGRIEFCATGQADLCPGFTNRPPVLPADLRPPVPVRWLVLILFSLVPLVAMLIRRRYPDLVRRAGGAAGLLGGLAWVAMLFSPAWLTDTFFILFFMLPAFLMALGAAGLAAISPPGRLAGFGLWSAALGAGTMSTGGVLSEWFRLDAGWFVLMIGILAHTIGLVLFGIANLRVRVLQRWNGLPILMGLFGGVIPLGSSLGLGYESDLPLYLLLGVLGGGWILLGGQLLFAKK